MALYCWPDYQTSFESIGLSVQKKFNTGFQDGCHLGFLIRMILAIFDLQVNLILPNKFLVKWPSGSGEDVQKIYKMMAILDFQSEWF